MLEALIIPTVFQSLPTIFPISIPEETATLKRQKRMKRRTTAERVKKLSLKTTTTALFPSFFAKTAGFVDNMCCCAYTSDQVRGEQADDDQVEYNEENSILLDCLWEEGDDDSELNHKPRKPKATKATSQNSSPGATRTTKTSRNAPLSPSGSLSTATTATLQTMDSWATGKTTVVTNRLSERLEEEERQWNGGGQQGQQQSSATMPRASTRPETISVPSRRLYQGRRNRSENDHVPYPELPDEDVIRKVQTESLAKLPYLSMTQGYQC